MLYQKSVLNKYLNEQNKDAVHSAYQTYKAYFHNTTIQQNIINSKEEQFQEGFLRELFVAVFGYVLNPQPDFNLTTEFKNEKGARKADGAILKDGKAVAVIELKSTKTKDLESICQQAFDYKANQSSCVYVITSNFQKLRFYINNAVEFEEFDLFTLTEEQFKLLFLCLNSENLLSDLPLKVKDASILEEETITKKFYDDYSNFKKDLFESIAKLNENLENVTKLQLYKKTQKLLDRFLFIFFAEDRGLLPPNSISRMIKRWNLLKDEDAYKPLYEIYKQYFGYLNKGRKGKVPADDIHEYNGGLFLPDEILANIKIDDDVLLKHTSILTNYDFESQVDVNILGHIFEHSLNEIESTTAELEGVDFDKQKSKRKKDGVFYTPKYITKYIVDNTVGKLCEEKKAELDITDDEFTPNRKKNTKRKLLASLESYRSWLLELTICDPACGSGAFLNQALELLIGEHHYIDQLNAQLFGSAMVFQDVENQILENNIFGVDINEESVDIARLSLWLRTAQRGRKLTTLNKNIKCGNSLIDDPEVAGDKAFKWVAEFPKVFAKGGFDVVIGNPPYVGIQGIEWDDRRYYETLFKTATGRFDLYTLFIEKAMSLKKRKGSFAFIIPGKILNNSQFSTARKIVARDHNVIIAKIDDQVFDEAHVDSVILLNNYNDMQNTYQSVNLNRDVELIISNALVEDILKDELAIFRLEIDKNTDLLIAKIQKHTVKVKDIAEVKDGVVAGTIKDILFLDQKINNDCHKLYFGKHLKRYTLFETNVWVDYRPEPMMKEEVRRKNGKRPGLWMRDEKIFKRNKILTRFVGKEITGYYDDYGLYYEHTLHSTFITDERIKPKYLLALYNSKLISYYYKKTNSKGGNIFPQVRISSVEKLPIRIADLSKQNKVVSLVEIIENQSKEQNKLVFQFTKYLQSKLPNENLTKKLQNCFRLDFSEFINELNKAIKKAGEEKLSKMDEMEWMEVFEAKKSEAQALKAEIDHTDKEIDQMVYELYGLTEEEIKIVEES